MFGKTFGSGDDIHNDIVNSGGNGHNKGESETPIADEEVKHYQDQGEHEADILKN